MNMTYVYKKYIRKKLPILRPFYRNMIEMPPEESLRLFDFIFSLEKKLKDNEQGVINCHNRLTKEGDRVVAVGGGYGVSAVKVARLLGEGGHMMVFEGSKKQSEYIKQVLKINNVSNIVSVENKIVAVANKIYNDDINGVAILNASDLPHCDILELDCEGAEYEIITNLFIRPKAIIVEMHPWFFDKNQKYDEILGWMEKEKYDLFASFGHDGKKIEKEEIIPLLELHKEGIKGGGKLRKDGPRTPIVLGFKKGG